MLRQNKRVNEQVATKCQNCQQESYELGGSLERSFRSSNRSNTPISRNNCVTTPLSTLGGGDRTSSRDCTNCQAKLPPAKLSYVYKNGVDATVQSN